MHCVVVGGSGSGKTYACKSIVEDMILQNIPVICIDVQGDLASLKMPMKSTGMTYIPPLRLQKGQEIAKHMRVCSIGSDSTRRYAIDPVVGQSPEAAAIMMLQMVGLNDDEMKTALTSLIEDQQPGNLQQLHLAGLNLHKYKTLCTKAKLEKLQRAVRGLWIGSSAEMLVGQPMTDRTWKAPRVIYLGGLDEQSQSVAIGYIVERIYEWATRTGGNGKLRAMIFIDEVSPYMPPVRNTPAKSALIKLLKKGRKYGVGALLATQSPGDLDYKGLANVGTWLAGKITQAADLDKLKKLMPTKGLSSQTIGQFTKQDGSQIKGRLLYTDHRTLTEDEIANL